MLLRESYVPIETSAEPQLLEEPMEQEDVAEPGQVIFSDYDAQAPWRSTATQGSSINQQNSASTITIIRIIAEDTKNFLFVPAAIRAGSPKRTP